jgi:hypothetical protein
LDRSWNGKITLRWRVKPFGDHPFEVERLNLFEHPLASGHDAGHIDKYARIIKPVRKISLRSLSGKRRMSSLSFASMSNT